MKSAIKTLFYAALCAAAAKGAAITITETQLGIGTFDGTAFNNLNVTITVTGDTSAIINSAPGFFYILGTTTVNVATLGTDTFTDSIGAFVSDNNDLAGVADFSLSSPILDTTNAAFATYQLTGSVGPLSGSPAGNPPQSFATLGGSLLLSSSDNSDHPSTFAATVATPEPGTIALCAAGLVLIGSRLRRK